MGTKHTSSAYEDELTELQGRLVAMGARCESLIELASRAMLDRDPDLAARVEEADRRIDADEVEIDELTVRILARRQPAARDLRFLVFALKAVTDLERIGDEAANMAGRAAQLAAYPTGRLHPKLERMAELVRELVHLALEAFVRLDESAARVVRERDDEVDALYGELLREALQSVRDDPQGAPVAMGIASTSKYLEHIADHATHIADMVVFVTTGVDVRHSLER
jgi:phosphate transport system protein